jgi:hypothetical protein
MPDPPIYIEVYITLCGVVFSSYQCLVNTLHTGCSGLDTAEHCAAKSSPRPVLSDAISRKCSIPLKGRLPLSERGQYALHTTGSSLLTPSGPFTTDWASPTCFLSVTSHRSRSLSRFRRIRGMLAAPAVCNCYCRGSEDDERRFRWRYTSVPYLQCVSV